uniref:FLYWCH-type domain-containing protein n=1 Tax=Meloidogyne hapla TaxID=6305 RepID=A0A1I8BAR4_MELHA
MSVASGNNNNKPITSPGPEFIYLTSAETEEDLDSIRCANQVHFKSYSSKNCWTKYECARSSVAQDKCKFRLLAASCDPNNVHKLFNIYSSGVHNHEIQPIEKTSSLNTMPIAENSIANNTQDDDIQILSQTKFENPVSTESAPTKQPALNEIRKKLPLLKICHDYNDLENFRRSEGLLVDKQFNVVNGIPEIVFYRCKINLHCSFTLQALYNNESCFFELYAPLNNIHFHSSSSDPNSSINNASINGNLQQNVNREDSIQLKRRLINVNLSEWNYIGEYETEESFEILRVQRKVSPLRERGKQFITLRQQTLKCYFRKPEKGKCRYRMLLFREWDGQPVKVYEKGVHNHKTKPKPIRQSDILSIQQAKQYYDNIMSSFIQQNSFNNPNPIPLQIPQQQQNCYPTTSNERNNNIEGINGRILNSNFEHSWRVNGMRNNIGWRFSLANCFSELKTLANGFLLDLTCTEESMVFKRRDNQNTFLIVSECGPQKEGLNVEECRNGCFSDHSEQWIKGDKLQFIRAMRTRIHEFMKEKNLG